MRKIKRMVTYTNNPNHWTNVYPWNRKGTNIRKALEQFLTILERHPEADQDQRRAALTWLKGLLDRKPGDLFP